MARSAEQLMFAHLVGRPEDAFNLDVAALLAGQWEYPDVDVARYAAQLDEFAEVARAAVAAEGSERFAAIRGLNRALYDQLGFRGNDEDYYDPRNSFLNEVLDRRLGIPITLAIVYMEVARRVGVQVSGVGFPGHFLLRYDFLAEKLILDPFRMGLVVTPSELKEWLRAAEGPQVPWSEKFLRPAGKKQILFRVLGNLSAIYSRRGDFLRLTEVLERMVILDPDNAAVAQQLERARRRAAELN